jgi:hypothetical protein
LIGARYKGKKPHFEISLKLRISFISMSTHWKKQNFWTQLNVFFSLFWAPKTHFRIRRHANIEKACFTLVFEFFCQSKFRCSKLKIQKIQKSTFPTTQLCTAFVVSQKSFMVLTITNSYLLWTRCHNVISRLYCKCSCKYYYYFLVDSVATIMCS